jgi:hypothetical protein
MRSLSAHWVAESATAAAWGEALVIQPAVEDIEAALAAGDWATCVDCAFESVLGACFVLALLDGYQGPPREAELLLRAGADCSPLAGLLEQVACGCGASEEDARRAAAVAREARELVAAALPLRIDAFRTPEGFYPGVRAAADLERLRERVGLGPFAWTHFTT